MTLFPLRFKRKSRRANIRFGYSLGTAILLGAVSWRPVIAGPDGSLPLRPSIKGKVAEILAGEDESGSRRCQ